MRCSANKATCGESPGHSSFSGDGALFEGDVDRATAKFQKALVISRDLEDAEGIALSLLYLGRTAHLQGDDARSKTLLEEKA